MKHLFIGASIIGCVAGAATTHGQPSKGFACDTDNGGLTLPTGFCAGVIADNLGTARNLVVAPNGDIFVSVRSGPSVQGQPPQPGFILGLRDTDGDGKIDLQEKFGTQGATGIRLRNGYLYYATPTSIERFKLTPGQLKPSEPAEVIVGDFPSGANQRDIATRTSPSTARATSTSTSGCRRTPARSPIARRGRRGRSLSAARRARRHLEVQRRHARTEVLEGQPLCHGMRQPVALDWHDGNLYVAMNSRDSLDTLYPEHFTVEDNVNRPLEPLLLVKPGSVFGWPYCFFDGKTNKMILAPEYGGDGKEVGRCAQFEAPVANFPAHYAPVDLLFYTGSLFPAHYRGGAFMTSHGSWNRAPAPMAGYNILFQPFVKARRPASSKCSPMDSRAGNR
jgi:glucose/arabinose dehydrogenase